ncbi:acyl-CoA dehydrogenase [Streptomyces sp. NPDC050856]|uniref:acyl-CoA dehydrogenase n=1 Tax=Streptomyces sp. NPDC050856 TaxID=3154939 RepID=UPI0033F4615B
MPTNAIPRSGAGTDGFATETDIWPRVTREVADDLAVDASARDRAGKVPFDEVARLREAGLPALLTPPEAPRPGRLPGRNGADWQSACAAVREIATADSSIGEILAHHHVLSWSARFFGGAETAARFELRTAREQWLLAGSVEPRGTEAGTGLTVTPAPGGYVLSGSRSFTAGVAVADRLVVGGRSTTTDELLIALVDPALPGVITDVANDRLGQRLTGAGSVTFDQVFVGDDDVLGVVPCEEHAVSAFAGLAPLALRLMLAHVGLGTAEGALAEARDSSRAEWGAWPAGDDEHDGPLAQQRNTDPYFVLAYGELTTAAHSAEAVVERATDALGRGLLTGPGLGTDQRADIAVLVDVAEAVTDRAAVQITSRLLELTDGADITDDGPGLDRFWRNARVLTARNSLAHRLRDIGDHYLSGTRLRLTSYA